MTTPQLTDIATLQGILQKANIQLSPDKSQHYLISPEVVEATVALAKEGPKVITELGAGLGTLTQGLVSFKPRIRAIERDRNVAQLLLTLLPPDKRSLVEVVNKDLRDVDWTWPQPYQVVGNIPYAFSGLIIRRLTQLDPAPTQAILLVQKEVGDRLTAQAGDMTLVSLAMQLWGSAQQVLFVPKSCFEPEPAVDSALIYMIPHSPQKYSLAQREEVLKLAKIFFQGKRKQMGGVLRKQFKREDSETLLASVGLTLQQRPQELTTDQWVKLCGILK